MPDIFFIFAALNVGARVLRARFQSFPCNDDGDDQHKSVRARALVTFFGERCSYCWWFIFYFNKHLHVDQMGNVVCPIQHGSVDESLGIFYEDLLRWNSCKNISLLHFQDKFQKFQQIENVSLDHLQHLWTICPQGRARSPIPAHHLAERDNITINTK